MGIHGTSRGFLIERLTRRRAPLLVPNMIFSVRPEAAPGRLPSSVRTPQRLFPSHARAPGVTSGARARVSRPRRDPPSSAAAAAAMPSLSSHLGGSGAPRARRVGSNEQRRRHPSPERRRRKPHERPRPRRRGALLPPRRQASRGVRAERLPRRLRALLPAHARRPRHPAASQVLGRTRTTADAAADAHDDHHLPRRRRRRR